MTSTAVRSAKLPPAWFQHAFWRVHRALNRLSGGRFLWTPASGRGWGALRLTTVGIDGEVDLNEFALGRTTETPVVVFEPRDANGRGSVLSDADRATEGRTS